MHIRSDIILFVGIIIACGKPASVLHVAGHRERIVYSDICIKTRTDPDVVSYKLPQNVVKQLNINLTEFVSKIEDKAEKIYHFTNILTKCVAGSSYDFYFQKTYESRSILSLLFNIDFQSASAAHGLHLQYGLSLSLSDGSVINPYSLLTTDSEGLYNAAYFNAFKQYKKDHPNCASAFEYVPHPGLARNAYFDQDTYRIVFNPYEIASYGCSTIEIDIPINIMNSLTGGFHR